MTSTVVSVELNAENKIASNGSPYTMHKLVYLNSKGDQKTLQKPNFSAIGKNIANFKPGDKINVVYNNPTTPDGFPVLASIALASASAANSSGSGRSGWKGNSTQSSTGKSSNSGYNGDGAQVGQALNGAITLQAAGKIKDDQRYETAKKILEEGEKLRQDLETMRNAPVKTQQEQAAMQASDDEAMKPEVVEDDEMPF